nr:DUF2721 domain-containing protein [Noviherbaspirillum massiliense]
MAPVFLLTAVGTIIGVLINRLSRIVDRIRALEERLHRQEVMNIEATRHELEVLGRRLRLIYLAVTCEVFCGLFVGLIIATAFIDAFLVANLSSIMAGLFILAMFAFISGLIVFLREIFLAVNITWESMR